jgi:hypothetical protein
MKTKVITYQSPSESKINLTPDQVAKLERAGVWPRDERGQEYCSVSHGLHTGSPDYDDEQLAKEVGVAL